MTRPQPTPRATDKTSQRFSYFLEQFEPKSVPQDAIVAPSLTPQVGNTPPLSLLAKIRSHERFLPDYPILWVNDAAVDVWKPVWLQRHHFQLCHELKPGAPASQQVPPQIRKLLYSAGVLTTQSELESRRSHGRNLISAGSSALERDRFCKLPELIDSTLTAPLAQYFNSLIDSGEWPLGDDQVTRRYGWHNERMTHFLHGQLTEFLSNIARTDLKPTYSYTSAYQGGADLHAHMDREQCDYTLSLLIFEERPRDGRPWPLWFQTPSGKQFFTASVSDGVFFRGCELPHWRDTASPEHSQINLLFHFVPADWGGVMD